MNKAQIGKANQYVANHPDGVVFFSYETPVAAIIGGQVLKTDTWHSVTTSRHINTWVPDFVTPAIVPQANLDRLAAECQ